MGYFEELIGVNLWTALFTLLNTLLVIIVGTKFLFKPVMKMIAQRQQEIDDLYADADKAKLQAQQLRTEYEGKLAEAQQTGDRIVKEATARGQQRQEEILRQANAEADAVRRKAESDIAREKKKAVDEAKNEIAGLAVDIAEKVVGEGLDSGAHAKLVDQFIAELGDGV